MSEPSNARRDRVWLAALIVGITPMVAVEWLMPFRELRSGGRDLAVTIVSGTHCVTNVRLVTTFTPAKELEDVSWHEARKEVFGTSPKQKFSEKPINAPYPISSTYRHGFLWSATVQLRCPKTLIVEATLCDQRVIYLVHQLPQGPIDTFVATLP